MSYASTVVADGATYLWLLGEPSGTTAADSVGTNTGTYTGTFTLGQTGPAGIGNGVLLDGVTGLVKTTNIARAYTGPWSMDFWFNTTAASGGLVSFANSITGGNPEQGVYLDSTHKVRFAGFSGSVISIASSASYNDGNWHYVAAVQDASQNMFLYVDSATVVSNANTLSFSTANAWQLGDWPSTAGWTNPPSQFINGSLCAVAIYNATALTSTQVAAHFAAGTGGGGAATFTGFIPQRMPVGV